MGIEDACDAVAEAYAEALGDELDRKPFDRDLLDALAVRLTGLVADIGCGPAHIGRYLFDRGVDVVGIDISAGMLDVARARNPAMRFEKADVRSLPLADDELGGAVAFYSLIYFEPDELIDALRELHRVLRSGGLLCAAVHVGDEHVHVDDWFGKGVPIDARFLPVDEVVGALDATGFRVDDVQLRAPYPDEHPTTRLYVIAIA